MKKRRTAEKLFAEYRPFALWVAKRHFHQALALGLGWDDVRQDALVGLWHASQSFDPRRGGKFKAFARHRISGAVVDGFRRYVGRTVLRRKLKHPVLKAFGGPDCDPDVDETDELRQMGAVPEDNRSIKPDQVDAAMDLHAAINTLSSRTAHIMRMRASGMTLRSIAECFGMTESRICQVALEAQREIRGRLRQAYA